MTRYYLSLDGQWTLRHTHVGQGTPDAIGSLPVYPYAVPGDIHTTFIEQGLIAEPLYGMNSMDCRWLEDEEFWCGRRFSLAEDDLRRHMALVFGGLDCTADIWLNGTYLGRHSNAFVEVEFDVSGVVRAGGNDLLVRIDQGLAEVQDKPLRGMDAMWNNEQPYRAWMRKPQYVNGWDWTIWLPTCGIWRSVCLTGWDDACLTDLYARADGPLVQDEPARVIVQAGVSGGEGCKLDCRITDAKGRTVAQAAVPCCSEIALTIPRAKLWWSNGLGEAHLYTVTVTLRSTAGPALDERQVQLGLRSIRLTEPALENGESGFTFVLNGVPVFCKGANVVPEDCLIGRVTDGQTRQTIRLARESNMNMLRVWGGGVYASEAFLSACDEAGLMVWHDFMFACGYHPDDDPEYMANVENEATRAIIRLRRHACVIGWSGNNEIQEMYTSQKQWKPDVIFHGRSIYEELLPRLVQKLHPGAIYRESSPLGLAEDPAGVTCGDQHKWDFTHRPNSPLYLDLWRFTDFRYKFLSEFGVIGAMNIESARKCIPEEHLHPDDPVWLFHTNTSQERRLLNVFVDKYFGGHEGLSLQQYILRSQVIQAEVTRHIYDECRARKFECSGLLFWTLGDSWGMHNWSLLDYWRQKRPVWHYLCRAMAPLTVVIRGPEVQTNAGAAGYRAHWATQPEPIAVWGVNDTLQAQEVSLVCRLMTLEGRVLRELRHDVALAPNASQQLAEFPLNGLAIVPEDTILHAALYAGDALISENRYFLAPVGEMAGRSARPTVRSEQVAPGEYRVELSADGFVWMAHLETPEGVTLSDNDFDLIPGMTRTVTVYTDDPDYRPVCHWIGENE